MVGRGSALSIYYSTNLYLPWDKSGILQPAHRKSVHLQANVVKVAPLRNSNYRYFTKVVSNISVIGICGELTVHGSSLNMPSPLGVNELASNQNQIGVRSQRLASLG